MKLCGKPMSKAKNGANRGACTQNVLHTGQCGSETCSLCGTNLDPQNTPLTQKHKGRRSGACRSCNSMRVRHANGYDPENYQQTGKLHTFSSCGCTGVLPALGCSNKFARNNSAVANANFGCRVSAILNASAASARKRGYRPIPLSISHAIIRKMMEEPNCERCGEPLKWEFGIGKTPHLHHNHETGEPIGFTHPVCNPRAMENEIDRLRAEIKRLK